MVSLRLNRIGKKKQPSYRVVAVDKKKSTKTKVIEYLGFYNPLSDPSEINLDTKRIKYWLDNGAQPSASVKSLLKTLPDFKNKKQ